MRLERKFERFENVLGAWAGPCTLKLSLWPALHSPRKSPGQFARTLCRPGRKGFSLRTFVPRALQVLG